MDTKLFISTFLLIFLAELGDKTQLAAMARTAGGEGGKWTIFLAASAALVCSTLIAVLIGSGIQKIGFPEKYIRLAAGMLFVLLGLLLLYRVFFPSAKVEAPAKVSVPGIMARAVLAIAADFEEGSAAHYDELAASAEDSATRDLFLKLAGEERHHIQHLRHAKAVHGELAVPSTLKKLAPGERYKAPNETAQSLLKSTIDHERATAEFYEKLATNVHIPALKKIFAQLAVEEREHARRLIEASQIV